MHVHCPLSCQVVPEPVEKWQAVRGAPDAPGPAHNMLDAFYKEPQRYAYTFQNYVFLTRVMQARRCRLCVRACQGCT